MNDGNRCHDHQRDVAEDKANQGGCRLLVANEVHLKEQLGRIGYVLPPTEERGVLPDTTANVQNEASLFKHFIITGPEVPGAIVETLFVSNDGDVAVLSSLEGQEAIVTAYENAIVEYFERYPPEAR